MRLTQGIHRAAQLYPKRPALVSAEGIVSWSEFEQRVARLAGVFQSLGLQPGDRVAMLSHNSPRYVEFYFAALWAGGVILTINTRWAMAEKTHCLNDARAKILLVGAAFTDDIEDLKEHCPSLQSVIYADTTSATMAAGLLDYEQALANTAPVADANRSGEDLAALFYTGGTTGKAKGVMLSHNNFMANSMNAIVNLGLSSDSIHLHVSPLFHLAGGSRLFTLTAVGGTHAVIPSFNADNFLDAIERFRVTATVVVPTMLNTLLQHPTINDYDVSSLRLLTYGASPMPEALMRGAMAKFPDIAFLQSYGMTELSPVATMLLPKYHCFEGPNAGRIRSAGQAVLNADIAVVDETGKAQPQGVVGEVCVRGPMVMQGYWRQPELTKQVVRDGWMHTGDAGYLDEEGFLFLSDRIKDMIISGGENVYSTAVENVLYRHEAILECAIIGIPDEKWGEAVHAIVVLKEAAIATEQELISHCRATLAGYECPKTVAIISGELPKSGVGKILKAELRKPFWPQ
ncbi:MAG: long-chain acyl-CoA synthetase [Paraglaciecola psychrophila]|jgi:long-chain acyl-CoA synthetase